MIDDPNLMTPADSNELLSDKFFFSKRLKKWKIFLKNFFMDYFLTLKKLQNKILIKFLKI